MKNYKLTLKKHQATDDHDGMDNKISKDLGPKEISELVKANTQDFYPILTKALGKKDTTIINYLVDGLVKHNFELSDQQTQNLLTENGNQVLTTLASHGETDAIYRLLRLLPEEQQFNKTLILNLITAAAINSHSTTVGSLIKNLFPE